MQHPFVGKIFFLAAEWIVFLVHPRTRKLVHKPKYRQVPSRQTDRQKDREKETNRETDTHTHICAGRQADRDRHTNRHANTKTDRQRQTVRHTHRKFREMTSSPLQDWKPGAWRKVTEWEKISPPRLSWNEHSPACVKHLKGQQSLAWAESVEQSSTDVVNGQPPSRKRGLSAKSLPTKNCSTVVAI